MPNDPTKPETAGHITFERFTETTLSAVLRAAAAFEAAAPWAHRIPPTVTGG